MPRREFSSPTSVRTDQPNQTGIRHNETSVSPEPTWNVEQQKQINAHFQSKAYYWKEIYQLRGTKAAYFQQRKTVVLSLIDQLDLLPGSNLLEVGCGAGTTTVELAQRGHVVTAVDAVKAMTDLTRQLAIELGLEERVRTSVSDVHHLPFPDCAFHVLLAVGLIPWVHSLEQALQEMARVLRPGGHLIVTADNRWSFDRITHLRSLLGNVLRRHGLLEPLKRPSFYRYCSTKGLDDSLSSVGLNKLEGKTVGFGMHLPKAVRRTMQHVLQSLADRGFPIFRSGGTNYIVLARKPGSGTRSSGAAA